MVRADVTIGQVIAMVMAVAKAPAPDPQQTRHLVHAALDGLRYQPERPAAGT